MRVSISLLCCPGTRPTSACFSYSRRFITSASASNFFGRQLQAKVKDCCDEEGYAAAARVFAKYGRLFAMLILGAVVKVKYCWDNVQGHENLLIGIRIYPESFSFLSFSKCLCAYQLSCDIINRNRIACSEG
ncbi:hypothetical protein O6H91_Y148700 [Diphasiastrum complanatum]|nr:hypothetical protein O6H91_Y148700 [Diphasiastrum complanatum]